jgi:DnaK suppressor protein
MLMETRVKSYKTALEAKRAELTAQAGLREDIAVARLSDAIDEVQQLSERELAISTLNRNWETIRSIEQALARIGSGSFGVCQDCEEAISEKRLKAVPWAALCIRCQAARDDEDTGYSGVPIAA